KVVPNGRANGWTGGGPHGLVAAHAPLHRSSRPGRPEPDGGRLQALRAPRDEPAPFAPDLAAALRHRALGHCLRGAAASRLGTPKRGRRLARRHRARGARVGATQARAAARRVTTGKRGLMATTKRFDVKDLALAPEGVQRIE